MKKVLAIFVLTIFGICSSFASLMPYADPYYDNTDIFTSPARLIEEYEVTHFGFEIDAFSAVDYLAFLSGPSGALDDQVDYLYSTMMNGDERFWAEYGSYLSTIFNFDNPENLPASDDIGAIRAYIEDSFANRFDSAQKASAVLSAAQNTDLFNRPDSPALYSDARLGLKLYGGAIYGNGFGWQLSSNIGFTESENLLSTGSNLLNVDVRGDIGYAFHVLSQRLTLGVSMELQAIMQNSILNNNLLLSRFEDNPVLAFSEDFKFGLGFALNFGTMYRHNDTLAFTLDLTNVASFRKFYDLSLTDFVDYDGFDEDPDTYYQPMDLILRALWDYGPYHVVVEFSNVINQVIWSNEIPSYKYDFFAIPKVGFAYDINDELSIKTRLGFSTLSFGVDWNGISAEISSSLNKLAFGIKLGYRF